LENKRVLNVLPDQGGGIESYYKKLQCHFAVPVDYFVAGRRPQEKHCWERPIRLFKDYVHFWKHLRTSRYRLVVVNPSLELEGVLRDGVFVLLASWASVASIVFFHGWREHMEQLIERHLLRPFLAVYCRTNAAIVLAEAFDRRLRSWGYCKRIYREAIPVDDTVETHDVPSYVEERLRKKRWRILYIGKIYKEKGVYEAVDALALLLRLHDGIELHVAGDGPELSNLKSYAEKKAPEHVRFHGHVADGEKDRLFRGAHCLLLPSYTEGMPSVVIEGMAFGLPIVTRLVGGLRDFFVNGQHGFATESFDPSVFAGFLEQLFLDKELYKRVSLHNRTYALANCLASKAALRLEEIYTASVSKSWSKTSSRSVSSR
jgi:glycosyltransferase involved in cell wall biosynthesis